MQNPSTPVKNDCLGKDNVVPRPPAPYWEEAKLPAALCTEMTVGNCQIFACHPLHPKGEGRGGGEGGEWGEAGVGRGLEGASLLFQFS